MAVESNSNPNCFHSILKCIQDIGIVVWCDAQNTYISSFSDFSVLYQGPPSTTTTTTSLIPLTTTTSTTTVCKNIFTYLIEQVEDYIENVNSNATTCMAFDYILNSYSETGQVLSIPKSENYCCPDCSDVYFFGSLEKFLQTTDVITAFQPLNKSCCTNSFIEVERYLILNEVIGKPTTCCNGFSDCTDKLLNHYFLDNCTQCKGLDVDDLSEIMLLGIVEYSTLGGQSLFCQLADKYIELC